MTGGRSSVHQLIAALAVLTATSVVPTSVATAVSDPDGDGLPDRWEIQGYDSDLDGRVDLNLHTMGADPDHPDIFVELDSMARHRLGQDSIELVQDSFLRRGIRLHVDNGPNSTMNPVTGKRWRARSQADTDIDHVDVLGSRVGDNQYNWNAFERIKRDHFSSARSAVFHYALSIHQFADAGGRNRSTGLSRGTPGSDFFVALGRVHDGEDSTTEPGVGQAGIFMHELGHNLGLKHGGGDDISFKPNYLSVMNYQFALLGVPRVPVSQRSRCNLDGTSEEAAACANENVVDYSAFGETTTAGALEALDEHHLDETRGLQLRGDARYFDSYRWCPESGGGSGYEPYLIYLLRQPQSIDWNCDGDATDTDVAYSITSDRELSTLRPHDDWGHLIYRGGLIGRGDRRVTLPRLTDVIDPIPLENLQDIAKRSKQAKSTELKAGIKHL